MSGAENNPLRIEKRLKFWILQRIVTITDKDRSPATASINLRCARLWWNFHRWHHVRDGVIPPILQYVYCSQERCNILLINDNVNGSLSPKEGKYDGTSWKLTDDATDGILHLLQSNQMQMTSKYANKLYLAVWEPEHGTNLWRRGSKIALIKLSK